jgi:hypothetical protein
MGCKIELCRETKAAPPEVIENKEEPAINSLILII